MSKVLKVQRTHYPWNSANITISRFRYFVISLKSLKCGKGGEPRLTSTVTGRLPHNRTATTKWCSMQYALGWRMTRQDQSACKCRLKLGVMKGQLQTADCRLHSSVVGGLGHGWRTALPKATVLPANFDIYLPVYSMVYVRHTQYVTSNLFSM